MPTRTQQERSATTRTKLLDATIEALVEQGYARTSTTDICRRAGVSRGAQLHHYPTKASLMASAVEHLFERRHGEFRALLDKLPESPDRVSKAFKALWKIYSGPTLCAWMELVVAARTDPELRRPVAEVNARFTAQAETTFKRLFSQTEPAQVRPFARLAMATLDGLALNHVLEKDDALGREVLRLFEGLIRSQSHGSA